MVSRHRRRAGPDIRLGPLLHARGTQGDRWRVSATILAAGDAEPPDMRADGVRLAIPPRFLHDYGGETLWRYDFAVPRGHQDGRAGYGFVDDPRTWHLPVPGTALPARIAYAACGGCEDETRIAAAGLGRNTMWGSLLSRHRGDPFHLLLLGGDQVYADGLWSGVPALADIGRLPEARRRGIDAPAELEAGLDRWYLEVYRHAWSQPETAAVLSSLPMLCMWDDHDILDGWGSHPAPLLDSPVYQAIYRAARRAFRLFQLGMASDEPPETLCGPPGAHSQAIRLDDVGILALDLRAERRPDRVLSAETWERLPGWLERFRDCRHLLLMSSVPVIFPGFGFAERLLGFIPGRQRLEDDLRDQWRSPAHREEWQRLLRLLAGFTRETRCRVSILSGEVHFGATGLVRGLDLEIRQFVSSGIVHPPPGGFLLDMIERMAGGTDTLFDGLELEMLPVPETGRRLLRCRNWLSLCGQPDGGLVAEWQAETGPPRLRLVLPAP